MPKPKVLKDFSELAKALTKQKRPRITKPTYEKVNYTIKPRPIPETPKGSAQEADQFMNELDNYIIRNNIDPATYPRSVRKIVWNAVKDGTYGPTGNNIQRAVSEEVPPDFFRYGPKSSLYNIDRDLKNATTAYDVIGLDVKQNAPGLSMDFLNSGLSRSQELLAKPLKPKSLEKVLVEQKNKWVGRPITTMQSDRELFYKPEYDDVWHSTYEEKPETFEDFYRRLTGYTGRLLDKNGGKLNGMKKTR